VRNTGCRFVNVTVPEPDFEPEQEQTFTRRQKRLYEQATGQQRTEAAAKPRTKKKKLGEAQQTRSKAKRTRSSR
jgi:hypothetical protein